MKRIFLIDSMSHIFRAYFAPMGARQEPLRNSQGQVTQAIFVFTNMLRKLINDEKPDYIAAIFDTSAPTFRHDSYAAYKANRAEMPDDLAAQLPYIIRVCQAMNIPIVSLDGYEADDIIGTFAKKAAEKKMQAVIVSNDKDLCQLVKDPHIIAMRQNSTNVKRKVPVPPIEWCDEEWVSKKFGLPPDKIIDLLGLMGDSIDNIPGAPGIGEKGALKLILEFGSAEAAMENADKVSHKTYRESLQNNQEIIRQSLELATIHCDVPLEFDVEAYKFRTPDRPAAYKLFRELEFNALTQEFSDSASLFDLHGEDGASVIEQDYSNVNDREGLDALVRKLFETEKWSFAVDAEDGEHKSCFYSTEPHGIAIATEPGKAFYVDLKNFAGGKDQYLRPLRDIFSNEFMEKSVHDYKTALGILRSLDIEPKGVVDDPMVAAYLLDSGRTNFTLAFLAQTHLEIDPMSSAPDGFTEAAFRACESADYTFRLTPLFRSRIFDDELDKLYTETELPLEEVLHDIECAGMKIDAKNLEDFSEFISGELAKLSEKIFTISGREFNIASPKQVGEVFGELNISTGKKTATGQISTSKDVLAELANDFEIAQMIIDYRELDKLKATYADSLPKMVGPDGRIHGSLNQTVAATGRLSSTDPNLQNIPIRTELGQRIRKAFIPEKGCKLISADYSQLELRILAHITKDPVMLEAFQNNEDIHAKTARLVFGATDEKDLKEKRRLAKIVNFGIAYAVEAFGLSQRVGISRAEAKQVIADYFETYKGIRKYMDEIPLVAREQGYVSSLFGRRRYFPSINDRNFSVRSRSEREAINMPIQGTASDIVKFAMINVARELKKAGLKTQMIMQVHDELLFEAPDAETDAAAEIIKREMESAAALDIPLIVELGTGTNWMDTK